MLPDDPALPRTAPFRCFGPGAASAPVVLAVPHAGRVYSAALLMAARVPLAILQRLEDRYADELVGRAVAAGHMVVIADAARALIDLNRAESDIDPDCIAGDVPGAHPSARARAGLGLVPHRLAGSGPLWRGRLPATALAARVTAIHRPYHQAIAERLDDQRRHFGGAVLLDIHSMPSQAAGGPQLVLGDRFGQTASPALVRRLAALAAAAGLRVARNHPYAGAHGVLRHARRSAGVEAVQVEFDRALYLDSSGRPDPSRVAVMGDLVCAMAAAAAEHVTAGATQREAAE